MAQIEDEFRKAVIDINLINHLINEREFEKAFEWATQNINENPECGMSLAMAGEAMKQADNLGVAAHFFEKALTKDVTRKDMLWDSLGSCWADLGYHTGNEEYVTKGFNCYMKALEINPGYSSSLNNLSIISNMDCDPDNTIALCERSLSLNPERGGPYYNMGLAYLMKRQWAKGWRYYDLGMGGRIKKPMRFGLPTWNGARKKVVVYGEQGLGDEIMFASCVPDMLEEATPVIECNVRLQSLFKRSFGCEVHGTRFEIDRQYGDWFKETDDLPEFQIPIGSLPAFYRTHGDCFPGTPYLKPDPELCKQYVALLEDKPPHMPRIGLAWTGGFKKSLQYRRSLDLRDLSPILNHKANFISLQYKNPPNDERVTHYGHILDHPNYDHTAALVNELDLIITVTTTMAHLCGALGKECWVLVPEKPQWRYLLEGDSMPWYDSVTLFRQKDGIWPIKDICERLSRMSIEKIKKPSMSRRITVSRHSSTDPRSRTSSNEQEPENSLTTEQARAVLQMP